MLKIVLKIVHFLSNKRHFRRIFHPPSLRSWRNIRRKYLRFHLSQKILLIALDELKKNSKKHEKNAMTWNARLNSSLHANIISPDKLAPSKHKLLADNRWQIGGFLYFVSRLITFPPLSKPAKFPCHPCFIHFF